MEHRWNPCCVQTAHDLRRGDHQPSRADVAGLADTAARIGEQVDHRVVRTDRAQRRRPCGRGEGGGLLEHHGVAGVGDDDSLDRRVGEGRVEQVGVGEFRAAAVGLHERVRRSVPGNLARDARWWDRGLHDDPTQRNGSSERRFVRHVDRGVRPC